MKPKILMIMILALVLMAIVPVQAAQTIQMANPDSTGQRDIIVYYHNGTLYGSYNTTSLIPVDTTNDSYIFVLKPQGNNIIDDPGDWLTGTAFPFVKTNIIAILLIFAAIGILVGGIKR